MLLQITYAEQSLADYGHICIFKNKMRICARLKAGGQTRRDIPMFWLEIFKIMLEVHGLLLSNLFYCLCRHPPNSWPRAGVYVYFGTRRKGLDFSLGKEKRAKIYILNGESYSRRKGVGDFFFKNPKYLIARSLHNNKRAQERRRGKKK